MPNDYRAHLDWIRAQVPAQRDELLRLSNINSGPYHAAGVNRVAERVEQLFAPLGANVERLDLPAHRVTGDRGDAVEHAIGRALRLRQRPDAPLKVFLAGHLAHRKFLS
jgi:glutamate carboxypeptidase